MKRGDGLPTIGLAVIVKDEEESLPRLLKSLGITDGTLDNPPAPSVDHIVVCDTGSTDHTKVVAEDYGCKVIDFEWCDDFSAARQASYDALPDWIDFSLWADADDTIEGAEKLRSLAASLPDQIAGLIFGYQYARDPAGNTICRLERERLVRHNIGERWELPVHEVLQVPGQLVRCDDVEWVHHKAEPPDPERNYKILSADLKKAEGRGEEPNPRTLVYLGTETLALGRPEQAETFLRRYMEHGTWDEELCQACHKLSIALRHKAEPDLKESETWALRAIGHRPDWADGYLDLAEIALKRERWPEALRFAEQAEQRGVPQTLLIINPLDYTYQPKLMRSVALANIGQAEDSLDLTQELLAQTPYRDDLRAQGAQVAQEVKAREAERAVLTLRELLVRHDENLKARHLLDLCVPYFCADRPAISAARADQREMTLHATDPEVYASYYRENPNESPFENTGVEVEKAHETFHRVAFLRAGLREQVGA